MIMRFDRISKLLLAFAAFLILLGLHYHAC